MGNDFFDGLSETLTRTAKEIGGKAESLYETQKLRNRISSEERLASKTMADIGKIIYKKYAGGEAMEGEVGDLCEKISQHMQMIAGLKEKLADMKGQKICPSCQKAVDRGASFCPYCGAICPAPEPEEAAGDVIEPEEAEAETEAFVEPDGEAEVGAEPEAAAEAENEAEAGEASAEGGAESETES